MKKLYLLFAFLFALIGYQDAGAWNLSGDNRQKVYLLGENYDGATWDWDGKEMDYSNGVYSTTVKATNDNIGLRLHIGSVGSGDNVGNANTSMSKDTWYGPFNNTAWNNNYMKFTGLTSGKEYIIEVQGRGSNTNEPSVRIVEKTSTTVADITSAAVIGFVDGATSWDSTGKSMSPSNGVWSWTGKITAGNNYFRVKVNGTEYGNGTSSDAVTLTAGTNAWTDMAEQNNNYCFSVPDTSKEYTFSVRKKSDGSCYQIRITESGTVTTKTISKVYLTNGSMQTELGKSGSNYVLSQNLTLTSGYAFKVDYSDATSATYGLSSSPANVNRAYALTEGNSTFALSSDIFASVTGLTVTVSGTALSTVSFAGTLKDTPASNVYLNGQWTNDTWTKVNMTRDNDNTNIYTANIDVTKKGNESEAWEFELVDNGTTYKEPGEYWYTDAQLGDAHVISTTYNHPLKHKLTAGRYTFTWNQMAKTLTITRYVKPVNVNMPLKKSDFAGGKSHYFLVGQRMGAYRLQPEWEFQPVEGENYLEIPDRLLYNGYVFVAKVDSYDEYVKHLYTGYCPSNLSGADKFDPRYGNKDFDLTEVKAAKHSGKFTSVRYNDINNTNPAAQVPGANWTSVANHYLNIASAEGIAGNNDGRDMFSSPSRAKIQLIMGIDGKTPVRLEFVEVSTDAKRVAELRTFSLVGGSITNNEISHVTGEGNTPLNVASNATGGSWQEAWIQYDADEKPYVDGYGEYIYQTVFQKDWLEKHPSLFNFPNDGDEPFRYTSSGITFTYDSTRKHDAQFGQRTVNGREERVITYMNTAGANDGTRNNYSGVSENYNDKRTLNTDNMVCYTVEGLWMEKDFKIWSGWSGCMQSWEYDDSHNVGGARWLRDNAGHGAKDEKRAVYARASKDVYFSLFENVGAADFATGYAGGKSATELDNWDGKVNIDNDNCERQYFNRVEIWFDTENNFVHNSNNASMICFRQLVGTPNIWIRNHPGEPACIDYNYDLPLVNGQTEADDTEQLGNIVWYKIERMPIVDGVEGERQLVKEETVNVARKDFHPIDNQFVKDESKLPSGRYRYAITVKREKTGETTYEGLSNRVYVPRSAAANIAVQQTKDSEGRWNFDLKFTAEAPANYVGVKVRDDEGNETKEDALNRMGWYEIKLPANFSYTGVILDQEPETKIDNAPYKVEGDVIKVGRLAAAQDYAMPDVTLENIRFGNTDERHFGFTANVGSTDSYWIANATVADGDAAIDLTVPATQLDIYSVALVPEEDDPAHLDGHGDRHNVRKGHTREDNVTDVDNGVNTALSKANHIEAKGNLAKLNVSDKVLANYDVKIRINLIYPGHEFAYTTPTLKPDMYVNSGDAGVTLSYLPLNVKDAEIAGLPLDDKAKALFEITDDDFSKKHGVTMQRTYNAPDETTVNYATHTCYSRNESQPETVESQVRLSSKFTMRPNVDPAEGEFQSFRLHMPAAEGSFSGKIGVQLHRTSWQTWYDAFSVIAITQPAGYAVSGGDVPHYSLGFFATNGETPATYDPTEPNHPIYPGGTVLDCSETEDNGYSLTYRVLKERPSKRNFGESAKEVGKLPVLIGNILNVKNGSTIEESVYQAASNPNGVLFTSYPIAFKHKDKDQLRPVVEIAGAGPMTVEDKSVATFAASQPVALLSAEVPHVFAAEMSNSTTDLDEVLGDFNTVFRAYPNPAVDIVNVEASAEIGDVEVIASSGAIVLKDEIHDTKGQLDVSALPAGLYLLRTQAGTTRLIVK